MQNLPIISVVMAVFNTDKYLRKSIQSVLNQTYADWELICINDGSTDDSLSILNEFAKIDSRIKVFSQENSGRHAIVFNRAVSLSSGKYIYSLDSDDYISSDLLEKTYSRIVEINADLCLPDLYFVDKSDLLSHKIVPPNNDYFQILSNKIAVELSLDWQIHGVGLWRSSILKEIQSDEDGFSVEFSARQRFLKCNSVVFSEGIYYYLQHEMSTTKKLGLRQFYAIELDYKLMQLLKENYFEHSVIEHFEWQRIQRIITLYTFFFANKNKLTTLIQTQISDIVRKSFYDINFEICVNEMSQLSNRRSIKYQFIFSNFLFFKLYCMLKSSI